MRSHLYTLPTFPLGSCPPASSISLSVFISLLLIANKVNEEELAAHGRTVHYGAAQYSAGLSSRPVIHAQ